MDRPDEPSRPDVEWKRRQAEQLEQAAAAYQQAKSRLQSHFALAKDLDARLAEHPDAVISGIATGPVRQAWYNECGNSRQAVPTSFSLHLSGLQRLIEALGKQAATWRTEYKSAMDAYNSAMSQYNSDMDAYDADQAQKSKVSTNPVGIT